jgi:glycosyltransferase involved in cell wall biosynthesis
MEFLISVIMLTYNRETLVSRAIECVLAQTLRDFEFIIVNNGSADRSGAIADEYAARDSRISVIHRERGNIGAGRNAGLDAARGEWIAFIDDDDWCEPDFLEFLYALADRNDADISICGAADKASCEKRVMDAEEAVIELLWRKRYNVQFPTKLLRRKLFNGIRFSDSAKYDDIEFMPKILAGANRVAYHGLPKYTFYRHGGNNSAWTTDHSLLDSDTLAEYLSVYRERTDWLSVRFPDSIPAWRYFEWSFMISMVEKITRFGLKDCREQADILKQELAANRDEFLNSSYILDFEKDWVAKYVPLGHAERNRNLCQNN